MRGITDAQFAEPYGVTASFRTRPFAPWTRTVRIPVHMVDKLIHMHASRFISFLSNYPAPLFSVVGCYHRQ
jgi:hypothetical protein